MYLRVSAYKRQSRGQNSFICFHFVLVKLLKKIFLEHLENMFPPPSDSSLLFFAYLPPSL